MAVVFAIDLGHAPRSGLAVYVAQTRLARGAASGSSAHAGAGPSGKMSATNAAGCVEGEATAPYGGASVGRFRAV